MQKSKILISIIMAITLLGVNLAETTMLVCAVDENQSNMNAVTEEDTIENEENSIVEDTGTQIVENEQEQTDVEDELYENSWRYESGELIPEMSARYVDPNAWNKVNGFYVNSFGEIIKGAQKKGIDVSRHQGKIDWTKVKNAGIEYAILRCGYGDDLVYQDDEWWEYNVSECERLGIPYGVYLYSYATNTQMAISEAQHVLRLLQGHVPSYPVYIDMEDNSTINAGKEMLGNIAKTFCDMVSSKGYRVGVYANLNWWNTYLTSSVFSNDSWSKWIAQYNYQCDYTGKYDIWQSTSQGRVDGINGNVDLNFQMTQTDDVVPIVVDDKDVISYSSHLQTYGWQAEVKNGCQSGLTGYSKRMEAFKIQLGAGYEDLGIQYQAYVQGNGWSEYVNSGEIAGTVGEGKAIEAIAIKLTGAEAEKYDIYYRVHCQSYGWMGWTSNGNPAGNQGFNKQVEAIQIAVVSKGATAPGSMENAFYQKPISVEYQTYVVNSGWQSKSADGMQNGTTEQAKAIEAIRVGISNSSYKGSIVYNTYMQSYGWLDEKKDFQDAGIIGGGKRVEAISLKLTDELAEHYDIYYRTYVQTFGWLDWTKNGNPAGTADYWKRIEAIQVRLVEKDGTPPGNTSVAFKQAKLAYRVHSQTYGWLSMAHNEEIAGTIGQSKRLEAIELSFVDENYNNQIEYRTHVQTYGWQDWVKGGQEAGTDGQSKRIEAIQIRLKSEMQEKYDIYYRVHVQTYGWLDWAKNGELAGTEGQSKRMEAIQVVLVEKGGTAPGSTTKAFIK